MKVLIIGGGAREHAIGWKLAQSTLEPELYFAPGNAGTLNLGKNIDLAATNLEGLLLFAQNEKIDLTLAIPDDPLALGIVDLFRKHNLMIFGPIQEAAQLESSKAFAKRFMQKYGLPTAKFQVFNNYDQALEYLKGEKLPVVIKASGLALGKGVIIAQTFEEAKEALKNILVKKIFGDAGNEVVIEEFLSGPEISIHAITDGESYRIFPASQDHKRVGENDSGLNTGGMGTIAPLPFVDAKLLNLIEEKIVAPTLAGMKKDGINFEGILYPGLILTNDGPKILEYNARFGDPETQTYMRLLESDLLKIFLACTEKKLAKTEIKWKAGAACNIVLASGGYPGNYEKGNKISGIENAEKDREIVIFQAGTKIANGTLVTNGGRVLGVSAIADDLPTALEKAYQAIPRISFSGMQYRNDIGKKALLIKNI